MHTPHARPARRYARAMRQQRALRQTTMPRDGNTAHAFVDDDASCATSRCSRSPPSTKQSKFTTDGAVGIDATISLIGFIAGGRGHSEMHLTSPPSFPASSHILYLRHWLLPAHGQLPALAVLLWPAPPISIPEPPPPMFHADDSSPPPL